MSSDQNKIKSILLINDYLSVCKLSNRNCNKYLLVRKYLCLKISKALTDLVVINPN